MKSRETDEYYSVEPSAPPLPLLTFSNPVKQFELGKGKLLSRISEHGSYMTFKVLQRKFLQGLVTLEQIIDVIQFCAELKRHDPTVQSFNFGLDDDFILNLTEEQFAKLFSVEVLRDFHTVSDGFSPYFNIVRLLSSLSIENIKVFIENSYQAINESSVTRTSDYGFWTRNTLKLEDPNKIALIINSKFFDLLFERADKQWQESIMRGMMDGLMESFPSSAAKIEIIVRKILQLQDKISPKMEGQLIENLRLLGKLELLPKRMYLKAVATSKINRKNL